MERKSRIFYYDENYKPCGKENAVVAHIHHLDDNGNWNGETIGYLNGKQPKIPVDFVGRGRHFKLETDDEAE